GGTKTLYSWHDGGIVSITKSAKTTADNLNNPLINLNEEIQRLEKLLKSKKFIFKKQSKHYDLLSDTLDVFREVRENELGLHHSELKALKLDFYEHLDRNPNSEIIGELNRINAVLKDLVTDIEAQNLRRAERSVLLAREKYEVDKVLEIDDKVKELKKTHERFLELASRSKMREQLKHDISAIEYEIQVAKESQAKFEKWDVRKVKQGNITDPFVGYKRQIIMTTENDPVLIQSTSQLAEKYPDNTTIVHMDKNGNYKVVHGLKLDEIPKGDLKVLINAHGNSGGIKNRSIEEIAEHISIIDRAIGEDSNVKKVSLVACSLGGDYVERLLPELRKKGVSNTKVSVRLAGISVLSGGRKIITNSVGSVAGKYRSSVLKKTYAFNEKGEIILVDSYTDEHYDVTLSIDKDGSPKIERIYGNQRLSELKGALKVFVKAEGWDETEKMLHQFKDILPSGASIAHLNIKTPKGTDWFAQGNALQQTQNLDNLGGRLNASVVVYSDSEDAQVSLVIRDRDSRVRIVKGSIRFMKEPLLSKNVMQMTECGGSKPKQQHLAFLGDDFDADIHVKIVHQGINQVPTTRETLENLEIISQVTQQPIADIDIIVPTTKNPNHYLKLVKALSNKYKVTVTVRKKTGNTASVEWLSKTPLDSDVTIHAPIHLAETQPHNDQKLQDWDTQNQEQINKLKAESQKTKPDLVNHNHQILFQTENEANVKDSTLKLALKHPTKTTIVQMQKDGTYRVVYGTDLDKITGSVKLSVVGYGRKTQEGGDTLGGRSTQELSANITKLNQALTDDATIRHISLVGCNLDNPTDNSTSTYAAQTLQ
ncbi:hypothetical protein BSPWISOX_2656, partial [uncultured Gammaproteobacteria bacterium]